MDLSIIIVNWNTKELLRECILSIGIGVKKFDYEIIVVDNGSEDHSVKMIKQCFPEVILIENSENIGYSKANNIGIKKSSGKYICLLNSDTLIINNALEKIVSHLEKDLTIGTATCLLVNPDGSKQFETAFGEPNLLYFLSVETRLYKFFPKSRIWGKPFLSYMDHRREHELEVCPSAVIVIRREVIDQVGLLDENIFFGIIDWDYSYRVRQKGWKQYFFPDARVLHYGGKSKKPILKKLLIEDTIARYYYFLKHYGAAKTNILRGIIVISNLIRICISLFSYAIKPKQLFKEDIKVRMISYLIKIQVSLSKFDQYNLINKENY
jgi:GT2 family glycosyltransferase